MPPKGIPSKPLLLAISFEKSHFQLFDSAITVVVLIRAYAMLVRIVDRYAFDDER